MANELQTRVLRKVFLRIVPFIMILYFVAFIDRVNIGFAALTMNKDLGFSPAVYGFGAGIFFWGYFLFEVPSNVILEKVGARLWIARVMVARGDLGVEIPHADVPGRQKELVRACRLAVKPVIVATQMLDSMVGAPTPTRAEASDVATAIYDGADAVMLSAESAVGQYPREAVEMMDRIIRSTESHKMYRSIIEASEPDVEVTPPHGVRPVSVADAERNRSARCARQR